MAKNELKTEKKKQGFFEGLFKRMKSRKEENIYEAPSGIDKIEAIKNTSDPNKIEEFLSSQDAATKMNAEERLTLGGRLHRLNSLGQESTSSQQDFDSPEIQKLKEKKTELEKQKNNLDAKLEKGHDPELMIKSTDVSNKIEEINREIKKCKRQEDLRKKYLGYGDGYLEERRSSLDKSLGNSESQKSLSEGDEQEAQNLKKEIEDEQHRRSEEKKTKLSEAPNKVYDNESLQNSSLYNEVSPGYETISERPKQNEYESTSIYETPSEYETIGEKTKQNTYGSVSIYESIPGNETVKQEAPKRASIQDQPLPPPPKKDNLMDKLKRSFSGSDQKASPSNKTTDLLNRTRASSKKRAKTI